LKSARFAKTNGSFQTAIANQKTELEALKLNRTNDVFDFSTDPAKTDFHSLLSQDAWSTAAFFNKLMRIETAKQVTLAAIALKRYQLKNGKYPASLDSLVPEFVSIVPADPVDGETLRYQLNRDGTFLLYSVGENDLDNGGNPAPDIEITGSSYYWQNPHALDWVWPQPATAEEIQKYHEERAGKSRS
jgi:hypothetical protein